MKIKSIFDNQIATLQVKMVLYCLLLFFALSGCVLISGDKVRLPDGRSRNEELEHGFDSPYNKWTNFRIPEGTKDFQTGYKDGCSTAFYSRGNAFYRNRYEYRFDPKMINNQEYRFAHARGYTYCFTYIAGSANGPVSSFDRYINHHGYDATYNKADINDAWDGFFNKGLMGDNMLNSGKGLDGILDVYQKGESGNGMTVFGGNPLWTNGSRGQFLGWE